MHDAIALLVKLAADVPSEPQYRVELAKAYSTLYEFLRHKDNRESAQAMRRSITLYEKLAADAPAVNEHRAAGRGVRRAGFDARRLGLP